MKHQVGLQVVIYVTGEPGKAAVLVAQSHSDKPPLQQDNLEAKCLGEREGDDWHCFLHSLPARLTLSFVPHEPKATPSC